jgi:hypothetical protein
MGILDPSVPRTDKWPNFIYDPGPPEALHAVAVISSCFNSFERMLFDLYIHHLDRKKYERIISESYFLALDESNKLKLLKNVFERFEGRSKVRAAINNLVAYFRWCSGVRNSVLHGEIYPTIFATKDLNLVKRLAKRSQLVGYLSLDVPTLRYLAERVEDGRSQAAKIKFHLIYRDKRKSRRSSGLILLRGRESLPKKLHVPTALKLSLYPHSGPGPQYRPQLPPSFKRRRP